ncbi:response regulator transcription factor [Kitasatospora sp. NPDC001603]|uniref:response regulator transcription factor n=1 Tax=Kitasatospora sp. NPDC001603 TaxID=3154388 RepID=UPI00331A44F1
MSGSPASAGRGRPADASPVTALYAVRRAAAGDSPYSPSVLRRVVARASSAGQNQGERRHEAAHFTDREQEVLRLVAAGLSNNDIADRTHIGVTTVKTHVANLMTKTGSPNRVRLAVPAIQQGLADT